jgi:hypothetical protein
MTSGWTWVVRLLGAVVGCLIALVVVNHAESPICAAVLMPFGALGFAVGNVHQGNDAITFTGFFIAAALVGAFATSAVCRTFWKKNSRQI